MRPAFGHALPVLHPAKVKDLREIQAGTLTNFIVSRLPEQQRPESYSGFASSPSTIREMASTRGGFNA